MKVFPFEKFLFSDIQPNVKPFYHCKYMRLRWNYHWQNSYPTHRPNKYP